MGRISTVLSASAVLQLQFFFSSYTRLVLRICSGNRDNYHSIKAEGATHKFGCSLEEAKALLEKARSIDMNVVGIRYEIVHPQISYSFMGRLFFDCILPPPPLHDQLSPWNWC